MTAIGRYRETVRVEVPDGAPVPNGDGGYTQAYVASVPPTWAVALDEAAGGSAGRIEERATTGTTLAIGTAIIRGRYRPDVTVAARLVHRGKVMQVLGVQNVATRFAELACTVTEVEG